MVRRREIRRRASRCFMQRRHEARRSFRADQWLGVACLTWSGAVLGWTNAVGRSARKGLRQGPQWAPDSGPFPRLLALVEARGTGVVPGAVQLLESGASPLFRKHCCTGLIRRAIESLVSFHCSRCPFPPVSIAAGVCSCWTASFVPQGGYLAHQHPHGGPQKRKPASHVALIIHC